MKVLDTLRRHFGDFIRNNSKLTLTVIFTLTAFVAAALVIILYETANLPKPLKKSEIKRQNEFIQTEAFFTPDEKPILEDYYFSREEKEKWTEEETDRWFTVPDSRWIESLNESNRQKVNKILGAAP